MCPCEEGKARALAAADKSAPDDEPISFAQILEAVSLADTLWCCRAEPQHSREWRLFAIWCARMMSDARSLAALDVAERLASGEATDKELTIAMAAADAAVWAAAWAADDARAAAADADAAARAAAAWAAVREAQAAAFLQLVTTGTLPAVGQEVAA